MKTINKVKLDFELSGELAQKLEGYLDRGLFKSKSEIVRDALRHLFEHLEEAESRTRY